MSGHVIHNISEYEIEGRLEQLETFRRTTKANSDRFFLVIFGSMIFLLQVGFAFLEAGSVRSKNVTNVLIKNLTEFCVGNLAFMIFGYAFAFGDGSMIIGWHNFALTGLEPPQYAYVFFQCTFASAAASIVSGAIAERCHFDGYIIFAAIVCGVTYPLAARWAWSQYGWLNQTQFQDFAGSGVIHLLGGTEALVGAIMLGPRVGRFSKSKNGVEDPSLVGHSVPLTMLGCMFLIPGFFAFNAGSTASISAEGDGNTIGQACLNTMIACCTSGPVVLFIYKFTPGGVWSLVQMINGSLAGMVGICSGCNLYPPWGAFVVSIITGICYAIARKTVIKLQIDDPLDAISVHFMSGAVGILLAPIFAQNGVLLTFSNESLMWFLWNLAGCVTFIAWSAVMGVLTFGLLKILNLWRVDESWELVGLDIIKHHEPAYRLEAPIKEDRILRSRALSLVPQIHVQGPDYQNSLGLTMVHPMPTINAWDLKMGEENMKDQGQGKTPVPHIRKTSVGNANKAFEPDDSSTVERKPDNPRSEQADHKKHQKSK